MGSSQPATTTTNSVSSPWSAATPLLQSLLDKYGSTNTSVTPGQSGALSDLSSAAASTPNFGNPAATGINSIFSNASTAPQLGMLNSAYSTLQGNLNPTASGANLDPYKTPGFSDALGTLTQDITNSTKNVFAGSGRDPSGAGSFAQSLGRGLMQGEAPVIASQYNTNMGNMLAANNSLYGAGSNAATAGAGLNTTANSNILSAIQGAGMIPGLYTQPASTELAAANTAQNLPFANLQPLLTAGTGIGALGGQSSGVGTQTPANNPLMNILGGSMIGAGLMFSDENVKENIEHVGELKDGQKVYSYNYKWDRTPQLGLLAQEVAEHVPEAVHDVGGVLAVDYSLATRRARKSGHRVGMLDDAEAA